MFRQEFADLIIETGMIPQKDLRKVLLDERKEIISELELLKFSFFDDVKFAKRMSSEKNIMYIDLTKADIPLKILEMAKKIDMISKRMIPIQKTGSHISLAIYDPSIVELKTELQTLFQHPIELILTSLTSWKNIFDSIEESVDEILSTIKEIKVDEVKTEETEDTHVDVGDDIINLVDRILATAYMKKVSDIHIEPYEHKLRIRFRLDGSLLEEFTPDKSLMLPMISRFKILSQLDISEKRLPQDGRIKLEISGRPIDYRVSSLPTLFGEKIVLRLLDQENLQLDMLKLGFFEDQLTTFLSSIHQPYGMCLVTGPTGSGKTTTLYSAISDLNKVDKNISTAEDPVEFNLEGINQVNIKKEIGLNFSRVLRAFLRQDPDIIMVGEIRDIEVGEIAVEASLTGHMVLSTLHTNDSPSTITRLLNMGIEDFLVASSLNVIVAQRLCRRICQQCKRIDQEITVEELEAVGLTASSAKEIKVFKGSGCDKCNNTGYKGRVAIYEVLDITPKIKEIILKDCTEDRIKKQAIKEGMMTLRMSALIRLSEGVTTLKEVVNNSSSDKF